MAATWPRATHDQGIANLLVYVPTLKWLEKGRWLYLRRPNAYLWLYDLAGIEHYIPVDTPRDRRR